MLKFITSLIFMIMILNNLNLWIFQSYLLLLMMLFIINIKLNNFFLCLSYNLGSDYLSLIFFLMIIWLMNLLMIYNEFFYYKNFFFLFNLILMFNLFFYQNLLLMFLYYEMSLIPMIYFIMLFNYQYERLSIILILFYYMLFISLPMIFSLIKVFNYNYYLLNLLNSLNNMNMIIILIMLMIFMFKMSFFMMHMWLPKVHVESSITGSIILSGILLKLGSYGLMRLLLIMDFFVMFFLFIIMGFLGSFYFSYLIILQNDIKLMVAYSSLIYMNLIIMNLFIMYFFSFQSSILLLINHSFSSSGMFMLVGNLYEKYYSRSFYINKGLMNKGFFIYNYFVMLMCMLNLMNPLSLGFFGELMLFMVLIKWMFLMMVLLILILFNSIIYNMYLFMYIQHGFYFNCFCYMKILLKDYLMYILLLFPMNFFFFILKIYIY